MPRRRKDRHKLAGVRSSIKRTWDSSIYMYGSFSSRAGNPWIEVRDRGGEPLTHVPANLFAGDGKPAISWLAQNGLAVPGGKNVRRLLDNVASHTDFEEGPYVDAVGWTGETFVLPSLDVHHFGDEPPAVVLHHRLDSASPRGSLDKWRDKVADPVAGHPLAVMALCAGFAPVLLDLATDMPNLGVEFIGSDPTLGANLVKLAASVVGSAAGPSRGGYVLDARDFMRDPVRHICARGDGLLPLVGIEAVFGGESPSRRTAQFKAMIEHLTSGRAETWPGQAYGADRRLVYLSSASQRLVDVAGVDEGLLSAMGARLIDISTLSPADREESVNLAHTVATALDAAARHCGVALPAFVASFVEERSSNEKRIRHQIRAKLAEFRRRCGPPAGDDPVRNALGLLAIAGMFAKKFGILPSNFNCGGSLIACYAAYRAQHGVPLAPIAERLREIAEADTTIEFASHNRKPVVAAARAMTKIIKGQRRLLIRAAHIRELLPDWDTLCRDPNFVRLVKRDGAHWTVSIVMRPKARPEEVYSIAIPAAPEHDVADDEEL